MIVYIYYIVSDIKKELVLRMFHNINNYKWRKIIMFFNQLMKC